MLTSEAIQSQSQSRSQSPSAAAAPSAAAPSAAAVAAAPSAASGSPGGEGLHRERLAVSVRELQAEAAITTKLSAKRRLGALCRPQAAELAKFSVKALGIGAMVFVLVISLMGKPHLLISEDAAHRQVISYLFLIGLFLVAVEDLVEINKSAVMLILSTTMWVFTAAYYHPTHSEEGSRKFHEHLEKGLTDVGSIILFLLPAMGVVESIDHFGGFNTATCLIHKMAGRSKGRLMPIVCVLSFFMSSVIDNLTATIVALKILSNVAGDDPEFRKLCGGLAVLAANAGGAWSPIGDVTTTMLWLQGKISVTRTIIGLLLPSVVAGFVPLAGMWWQSKAAIQASTTTGDSPEGSAETPEVEVSRTNVLVLVLGLSCILMVPLLKIWTGLPPYLGMLFALGIVWVVTESLPKASATETATADEPRCADLELNEETSEASASDSRLQAKENDRENEHGGGVPEALHKVDLTGLLFFAGVLMAVVALDAAGVLERYALWMKGSFGNSPLTLCTILGVSSAVVDNVPLVEASINMFENSMDDPLWQLVALAAGTGGSILSIGSIAGVTLMSMEGVGFLWYLRNVSLWAVVGFALSMLAYEGQRRLMLL